MNVELEKMFEEVAKQMQSKFREAQSAIQHHALKGNVNEKIVRNFLRKYLPKSLDISLGELIDSEGRRSKQIDVIISDAFKTPIFYKYDEIRVIPIECVYAIIEVKAKLDSTELTNAFNNMQSVRLLKKRAYINPNLTGMRPVSSYEQVSEIWPVNYFVFAFDSIDLMKLQELIGQKHEAEQFPLSSRIDTVCVIEKGVITNAISSDFDTFADAEDREKDALESNVTLEALPSQNSRLYTLHTKKALLSFYILISNVLHQARMPDFQITQYFPFHNS